MRFIKGKLYTINSHNWTSPKFGYYSHSGFISQYNSYSEHQVQVKYFYFNIIVSGALNGKVDFSCYTLKHEDDCQADVPRKPNRDDYALLFYCLFNNGVFE